jgi:hypothetical protein
MNTRRPLWVGARWQDVIPALLPGLLMIAQRSGLLRSFGGASFPGADMYAVPVLCLALVLVSWLREHRCAVWTFPALGTVLAVGLMMLIGAMSVPTQLLQWTWPMVSLILAALVWGALLALVIYHRIGGEAPLIFWLLFAALIGAHVLRYLVTAPNLTDALTVGQLMITALPSAVWLGLSVLPVLIVWRLGHEHGTMAALVVLAAEFWFADLILDPAYAIGMRTKDVTIIWFVHNLSAIAFLIVAPFWVLMAQSFRSRTIGFLLPSFLALMVAELLRGVVRSDMTPAAWLGRGLGVAEFLLILMMALVAYDAIQIGRVRAEPRLQPAQEAI